MQMSSNYQWKCRLWDTNDTYLGYLSAVSVNTPFTEKKWGLGLSYWHQWLNTTETLTNSLPNEKQVSFTCEHLFPWEAIISSLQLHWLSAPALTSMLRLMCSRTSLQSHCPGSSSYPLTSADEWIQGAI